MEMLRKLKKYPLAYDKTFSFFRENMDGGSTLSQILLKKLDLSKGHFFTLLPDEIDLDKLYVFKTNEILSQEPIRSIYIESMNKSFQGRWINSIKSELIAYLKKYLFENPTSTLIFEDVLRESDDENIKELSNYYKIFNKEVYYNMSKKGFNLEILKQILHNANALWHMLGLSYDSKFLSNPGYKLEKEDLNKISENIKFVLIRAYDGAAYIFWKNSF